MAGRRSAPRPKRGGEEFSRTHHLDDDGPNKKPRFDVRNPSALVPDAPEEDAILEADEIGKRGQQVKRNAINIDGYESDSDNEGFDARAEVKAKEAKRKGEKGSSSKKEEEDDMFADLDEGMGDGDEDEEVAGEGKKKDKSVRFLEASEIEGQVLSSTSGGHVSADFTLNDTRTNNRRHRSHSVSSSGDSDVPEEERADAGQVDLEIGAGGKKSHAPKLDAFNMKSEQEEGRFDASGNYVRKAADPDAVHDSWLEGVSKKDMKKAKEAADKRDEERRQKAVEADAVLTSDILKTLIPYLDRGETVLEALARLGKGKEKKKPKWHNKSRNKHTDAMDLDAHHTPAATADDPAEINRREAVETITGAADQLLTRGQTEIYDAERELLMRQYKRETGDDWVDAPVQMEDEDEEAGGGGKEGLWEYRWSDARDGGETHGPYDRGTMNAWEEAGYFGEGVEYRRVGGDAGWQGDRDFS